MAKTKTGKTTKGSRQPQPKKLGIKIFGGQRAKPGSIIIRQKGTKYHPGVGTDLGSDYTLFAKTEGIVKFYVRYGKKYVSITSPLKKG